MSPIGETLRAAREAKGLSLDRVSDETNIAKRYLTALESEDFAVFPGDPYAIGFLRNYADYLGLASDDLVATFRNMRIQEQPVPIQELIPKRGPSKGLVAGVAVGAVAVIAILIAVIVGSGRGQDEGESAAAKGPVEYRIEGAAFDHRLYEGDTVLVKSGVDSYRVLLARIDDAVSFETPSGKDRLMLGEEATMDLDKNGNPEIKVLVSDFAKKDPSKGAVVHIEYINPDDAAAAAAAAPDATPQTPTTDAAMAAAAATPATPVATVTPATAKSGVLFESAKTSYPFVVSVTFRGPCMFRYEADKRDRTERYYHKGDTITVNANNSVKIWTSNAQFVKLTVQASGGKSADVELGKAGEVTVKRIAWSQTESGGYALSVYDVD
jgi:cytoskeletal protein RodZ